jgi:NitT/TauT family transport system ATP-binding protein
MLSYTNVSLTYPGRAGAPGVQALAALDLSVAAGESIALIGPSGCGKSTALLLAAGLLQPSSGQVLVAHAPAAGPRQRTALILQDFGLLPWKTVFANAALGLKVRRTPKAELTARTSQALELVGLSDFAAAYPAELSGGMRQRLALARAITLDIDLLLMDEPLSALDTLLREQLQDLLLELWHKQGYAQVLVTHSIEEAVFLGQRIVVLGHRPGHVLAVVDNPGSGSPAYRTDPLFHQRSTQVREALAGAYE